MKSSTKRGLLRLLGPIIFAVIAYRMDWSVVGNAFAHADLLLLAGAAVIAVAMVLIKAVRWHVVIGRQGIELPLRRSVAATFASLFLAMVTPGRLGELARAVWVKRDSEAGGGLALSGVVLDRWFDVMAIAIGCAVGGLLVELPKGLDDAAAIAGGLLATAAVLALSQTVGRFASRVFARIPRVGGKLAELTDQFYAGLAAVGWSGLAIGAVFTAVAYGLIWIEAVLVFEAVIGPAPIAPLFVALLMANALSYLPISFAGVGTREAVFLGFFATTAAPAANSVAFSMSFIVVTLALTLPAGLVCWFTIFGVDGEAARS